MTIGDSANRMTEDLDRRLRDVLVVVRRTRLSKILEHPGLVFAGFDVRLGLDAGEIAELLGIDAFGREPPPRNTGSSGADSLA